MQTKMKSLLVFFIFLLTAVIFAQSPRDKFVVVLDAGHGDNDPGNTWNGFKEKDIALAIVLNIGRALEKHKDIEVVYTRKTDVFVDLHKRGAIANKADADLFVSIHCNGHSSQANGTETWVLGTKRSETNFNVAKAENEVIFLEEDYEKNYEGFNPDSPESLIGLALLQEDYLDQSILLATYVQDNFKNKIKRKSRGVKQAGFIVLHQTYMPSILVETGFLSYKKEGAYLNSKKGKTQMASAIKDAIIKYKNNLNSDFLIASNDSVIENEENIVFDSDIVYKVQIAAGSRKLETRSYNFNGLKNVSRTNYGNGYKYFYGETSNYSTIKKYMEEAKTKGYKTCFIVAFRDGKRVPLEDIKKLP